jgi:hypothetical protein
MSTYRQKKEQEKPKPQLVVFGCIYVAIVGAVAFLIASFLMQEFDIYRELGAGVVELPLVNKAVEMPEQVVQVALAILIFFFLQPFAVILAGSLGLRRTEEVPEFRSTNWRR